MIQEYNMVKLALVWKNHSELNALSRRGRIPRLRIGLTHLALGGSTLRPWPQNTPPRNSIDLLEGVWSEVQKDNV